jgi:molecular chaperone DnaK
VTFDIDANGIVNVSAQDKATGKAHNITIQASGGLDDNEIERMVKEAEDNAEADKEKREVIDVRNQAESMIHGAEKSLTDLGDKADPSAKTEVEQAIVEVKTALEGNDINIMKDKTSALSAVMMKMGEAAYKANEENSTDKSEATDKPVENKEDVVDADFEEVKDDEEKKDAS